jgi:16S rRNA processing protein RimM
MAYEYNILLGRIIKVSGYEGAVAVKIEKEFVENIPQMESVFLEIEGRPVPFFVSGYEYSGADILKLRFQGYESVEKTGEFVGCRIYLTDKMPAGNKSVDKRSLTGYKVFDQENKLIGLVSDLILNSGQWLLCVISSDKKENLIPFHENLILSLDRRKKIIVMEIADGLIGIN